MFKRAVAVLATACALGSPALAGEAGDLTRSYLYEGQLVTAHDALTPLADAGDAEARFGLGMVDFVQAVEGLGQGLYRYGLAAPDAGPMAPMMSLPIPANPAPQTLDYASFRGVLEALQAQLDLASDSLQAAGAEGDYVVPIDILRIRVDITGDGVAEPTESIGAVLAMALGIDPSDLSRPASPTRNQTGQGAPAPAISPTEIGFDRADAIWLAGYSNVVAAQADFLLAHDFTEIFNAAFHRLFPRAGLPMQGFSSGGQLMMDPVTDNAIADLIAAVHTINWPVIEPDRLRRVHTRLKTVVALSRRNWEAILAETDDDRELVPNPNQSSVVPGGTVTAEMVTAWRATLDATDRILDGTLLIPHWRFRQGFDLKAYFETATRTDFIMILTGYGALPFLRDGPVADAGTFAEANRVFGDNLLGYAFWFN